MDSESVLLDGKRTDGGWFLIVQVGWWRVGIVLGVWIHSIDLAC